MKNQKLIVSTLKINKIYVMKATIFLKRAMNLVIQFVKSDL